MKISFHINYHTVWGEKLCMLGSIPELGLWEKSRFCQMYYTNDGNWQFDITLSTRVKKLEYCYFLINSLGEIISKDGNYKRTIFFEDANNYSLYDFWQTKSFDPIVFSSAFTKCLYAHSDKERKTNIKNGNRLSIELLAPFVKKNQSIAISGNQPFLGSWNSDKAVILNCYHFPIWSLTIDKDVIKYPFEYKFCLCNEQHKIIQWEDGENRKLSLPEQQAEESVIVTDIPFRCNDCEERFAGTVIPVFSLRSEKSFGVGDLGDLKKLIDWAKLTHQHIIQVLPMNDTTMTHSWKDSYPYSAISIYALHPIYISLQLLGKLKDKNRASFYSQKQKELNALPALDYEQVMNYKIAWLHEYMLQEGSAIFSSIDFKSFLQENESWLMPYAAFCYLRDKYHTSEFHKWKTNSVYDKFSIKVLCSSDEQAQPDINFSYLLQYILHKQFKSVTDYARGNGIVLKGDIPIGVNRTSVETWTEPQYFNMNGQAGAPPDDFSNIGQNWGFPTYNWNIMESDGFNWWKNRFHKMEEYFDCFRIDHILGFFRIWEVPIDYVQGLCGHFNPALPLSIDEIRNFGFNFNETRMTNAHINRTFLLELFGDLTDEVTDTFLAQSSSHHFVLKSFCDTQRKIEKLFERKDDEKSNRIKKGLYAIANEVLFLHDPYKEGFFHPRISGSNSYIYRELSEEDRQAFNRIHEDFFFHRHNEFWKQNALRKLQPLVATTEMLVCGEDLGMIPSSVPDVMKQLNILSLELERAPKTFQEFADTNHLPYHSVCTTSTHDMPPLRNWWKENPIRTQCYYNQVLHEDGKAPEECSAEIATKIISNHLASPSLLTIIPLQDWFATDDNIKSPNERNERINVPANPQNYWRYRMHITLEKILDSYDFNEKISHLIDDNRR